MYPLQHIRRLRALVIKYNLPRPAEFDLASDERLQEIYNGIGSEKYRYLLHLTTDLFSVFEAAALVHDFCWSKYWNDGSVARWKLSNDNFRAGNHILARKCSLSIRLFRPQQRAIIDRCGDGLFLVVANQQIGWHIWQSAEHCEEGSEA